MGLLPISPLGLSPRVSPPKFICLAFCDNLLALAPAAGHPQAWLWISICLLWWPPQIHGCSLSWSPLAPPSFLFQFLKELQNLGSHSEGPFLRQRMLSFHCLDRSSSVVSCLPGHFLHGLPGSVNLCPIPSALMPPPSKRLVSNSHRIPGQESIPSVH